MNIFIINGPNLNLLGIREKNVYGEKSYDDLVSYLYDLASVYKIQIEVYQSNHEGDLIDKIHEAYFKNINGIIINPGAYSHYSYAIRDAILATSIKTIEVHLSDINTREEFRKYSVIKDICDVSFSGLGFKGYEEALKYLIGVNNETSNNNK